MRYIAYGLLALTLMSGCTRYVGKVPVQQAVYDDTSDTKHQGGGGSLYQQVKEGKHKLKPEPFSASSNKEDPEILGPQRTLSSETEASKSVTVSKVQKNKSVMTKEECVSMVGQAKFDMYSKKFGGDAGVLKRCTIIKRLKRR